MNCVLIYFIILILKHMNKYTLSPNMRKKTSEAYIEHQMGPLNKSQSPMSFQRTPTRKSLLPFPGNHEGSEVRPTQRKSGVFVNTHVLVEQNKQLITENKELNSLLYQKIKMLEAAEINQLNSEEEHQQLLKDIQAEKIRFIADVTKMKMENDKKIQKLVSQVNRLLQQKHEIENHYESMIRTLNQELEQERKGQLQSLAIKYNQNIALYKQQIQTLKANLQSKTHEFQIQTLQNKQQVNELENRLTKSENEMMHSAHRRKLQNSQLKQFYENKIQRIHLEYRRQKETFLHQHDTQVKKLQIDVQKLKSEKEAAQIELEKLQAQNDCKILELTSKKENVESDIAAIQDKCKQTIAIERQKEVKLSNSELQMIEIKYKYEITALLLQNNRLMEICNVKAKQTAKMEEQLNSMRENHLVQMNRYEQIIKELQSKIYTNQIENLQGEQIGKVKYAQLRQADIRSLKEYYENQIGILMQSIIEKDGINQSNREKFHQELKVKGEMRKNFEIDQLQNKVRIRELEVQIANLKKQLKSIEHSMIAAEDLKQVTKNKQQIGQNKIENIREGEERNWKNIINSKDKEIQQLQARIRQLKDHHSEEILQKQREIVMLRQKCDQMSVQRAKTVNRFQTEVQKLKSKLLTKDQEHRTELITLKQEHRQIINDTVNQHNKIAKKYDTELIQAQTQCKKLQQQVDTLKREAQQQKHNLNAALNITKESSSNALSKMQNELESYYNSLLFSKDSQITDLQEQLLQKENDLRDAKLNYATMQRKLQQLIQSQGKLREIDLKVMNIGMDNNSTKNMREIIGRT